MTELKPKHDRYDKVKFTKMTEVEYFIIDVVYKQRPFAKKPEEFITEPHYDLKHPSTDYKGRTPKFVPESQLLSYQ